MINPYKIEWRDKESLVTMGCLTELSFDEESGEKTSYLTKNAISSETYMGNFKNIYRYKYSEVLSPQITFIKEDFEDFTESENREMLAWLTGSNKANWLSIYNSKWDQKTVERRPRVTSMNIGTLYKYGWKTANESNINNEISNWKAAIESAGVKKGSLAIENQPFLTIKQIKAVYPAFDEEDAVASSSGDKTVMTYLKNYTHTFSGSTWTIRMARIASDGKILSDEACEYYTKKLFNNDTIEKVLDYDAKHYSIIEYAVKGSSSSTTLDNSLKAIEKRYWILMSDCFKNKSEYQYAWIDANRILSFSKTEPETEPSYQLLGNFTDVQMYKMGGRRVVGYVATFEACTPWAYNKRKVNTPNAINIQVRNDEDESFIYPKVTIEVDNNGGTVTIANRTLNPDTESEDFTIKITGCVSGEKITIDGRNQTIISDRPRTGDSSFSKTFNWTWLPFVNGKNTINIHGTSQTEATIKNVLFEWNDVLKMGEYLGGK